MDWRRIVMRYDRCTHTFFRPSASPPLLYFIELMSPGPRFLLTLGKRAAK